MERLRNSFLSVMLTLVGGVVGIIVGMKVGHLIDVFLHEASGGAPLSKPRTSWSLWLALVGIFPGLIGGAVASYLLEQAEKK